MSTKERQEQEDAVFPGGSDQTNITGGLLAAYVQQRILLLIVSALLALAVCGLVGVVLYYTLKKPVLVFLKNPANGEVVQVDPSTLKQSLDRDEFEIKGFAVRWVLDAYTFNPGNVRDAALNALRYVEPKAQGEAKAAMLMNERNEWVSQDHSGGIDYQPEKGRMPSAVINSWDPLDVTVVFSRIRVRPDGSQVDQGPMALKLTLHKVPRSSAFSNGLMISHITPTN